MEKALPPAGPRLPAGAVLQHYEIIRLLGSGGMGAVFLARDTRLGRLVAVKRMSAQSRPRTDRFLIEARATAQLAHENVVVIHDVGEHDGAPYMVLEYLRGKTLQQLLQERRGHARLGPLDTTADTAVSIAGATADTAASGGDASGAGAHRQEPAVTGLPPERAVELMLPVVRALAFAHERGVVHRDLKPANVMVTDTGVVKVLDFGIAKLVGAPDAPDEAALTAPDDESALTRTGAVLGTRMYMAPEQWRAEPVDHRADLWAVGVILAELVFGQHPLAPLSRAALATIAQLDVPMPSLRELRPDLGKLGSIIDRCLRKRVEERTESARDLCSELEALTPAARAAPGGEEETGPFVGLSAFQESDAGRFFGRGKAVAEVVSQLAEQPLLVIVGPSGAGKSSFVRAGVIPALGRAGDAWEAFTLRPGTQPVLALAELLLGEVLLPSRSDLVPSRGEVDQAEDRESLAAKLRAEPGLLGARLRAHGRRRRRRVLVFVDQAEELYTIAPEAERAAFFACLGGVADDVGSPLRTLLAIRSDFLDRLAEDRAALGAPGRGILLLSPMHRDGLREALVQPLAAVEHAFEPPELVEEMLDVLEHTRAALPLLSFTAARLWEQRDRSRRVLTEESYRRMGGIGGALAGHAGAVLGAMSAEERKLARAAFLRLVTPERTRALCTLSELRTLAPEPAAMDRVLGRLIDARLLAVDGGETEATAEIVHESLISGWPALVEWLSETAEDAAFLARLRNAAKEWEASGRSEDLLWRGRAAEVARQWQQRYSGELASGEERYVKAVIGFAERSRRRGRRIAAAVIAALSVTAVVVTFLAFRASRAAERAEALAASEAREKESAQSEALRARDATRMAAAREHSSDPTTALALLREIEGEVPPGWADLARSMLYAGVAHVVFDGVESASWSPDGKRVLSISGDKTVRVWNADGTGDPLVLRGHEGSIWSAAWSPDGKRIVSTSRDKTMRIWNADGIGEPPVIRVSGSEERMAVRWSPDGKRIATYTASKMARVWNADGSGEPLVLRGHEDRVYQIAWSPDSMKIASSSFDKTVRVWSADGSAEPLVLRGHQDRVLAVAWSPDGRRIVSTSGDKTVRIWDADGSGEPLVLRALEESWTLASWSPTGKHIITIWRSGGKAVAVWNVNGSGEPLVIRHEDALHFAEWSPDGQHIVTTSNDKVVVWAADGSKSFVLGSHDAIVWTATWSPDGQYILAVSEDKTARVWSVNARPDVLALRGHGDSINTVAWSPDGGHIVTASDDGTVRVWNADDASDFLILDGHDGEVSSAAWSPNGQHIVTASKDTARVWNADGTGQPLVLRGHEGPIQSAKWSPDGKRIVTASKDTTARVWAIAGADEPRLLRGHQGQVLAAAWSPDGKRIVTASEDETARVWTIASADEPRLLRDHEGRVLAAAWSPDGKRIVTTALGGTMRVWNADDAGEEPVVLHDPEYYFLFPTWSPGGKYLAAAGWDMVRLWKADLPGELRVFPGRQTWITGLAWNADGTRIASASQDRTVRIWNTDGTGEPLILRGAAPLYDVAFSPDGKRLAAASDDHTVWIWSDIEPLLGTQDPRLWTATNHCLSVERRIQLLNIPEALARAQHQACLARVAEARATAPNP